MRVTTLVALFAALSFAPMARAQERTVPHYFPDGIETISTPVGQWEAYTRYLTITDTCDAGLNPYWLSSGSSSKVEKIVKTIKGKKVTFIFDPWIKSEDGKHIYFYNYCGQKEISQKEFDLVAEDYIAQATQAMSLSFAFYGKIEQEAVTAAASAVGKPEAEFRKLLDEKVPEAPAVTYRELWYLPRVMTEADSIPTEVHIGYISALGEAWLNSGVVYTSIQSRIVDYITGKPMVMVHEFIHANTNLQSLPLSESVDVELMASVPEMLFPEDKVRVARHGYMGRVREWIWVFFGFDFKQVNKEVVVFDHDRNQRINEAKFNEYYGKLEAAKAELLVFFKKAMPAFYANQIYWTSLNQKLGDTRGVFSIQMAMQYDPTILGGRIETAKWLSAHEAEIRQIAKESFEESGKEDGASDSGGRRHMTPQLAKLAEFMDAMGITREEGIRLARKYHLDQEELKGKSPEELTQLVVKILQQEKRGKER